MKFSVTMTIEPTKDNELEYSKALDIAIMIGNLNHEYNDKNTYKIVKNLDGTIDYIFTKHDLNINTEQMDDVIDELKRSLR